MDYPELFQQLLKFAEELAVLMIVLLFLYLFRKEIFDAVDDAVEGYKDEVDRLMNKNEGLSRNLEEYEKANDIFLGRISALSEDNKKLSLQIEQLQVLQGINDTSISSFSHEIKEFNCIREELEEKEHGLQLLLLQERKANDALVDYLYFAAHDSERNFSAIGLAFHYLQEKLNGNPDLPELPKLLHYQSAAIEEFRVFINNLFGIAKREAKRIDHVVYSEVLIKEFFSKIVSIIDLDAAISGNQTISLIYTPGVHDIWVTDETMLRQIVANLLINAKERTTGAVFVILSSTAASFTFLIMNQGNTIPDELTEKIFDKEFTTNRTTGRGIGLTITKSLIEALGGSITVNNQDNIGPMFTVSLPYPKISDLNLSYDQI